MKRQSASIELGTTHLGLVWVRLLIDRDPALYGSANADLFWVGRLTAG